MFPKYIFKFYAGVNTLVIMVKRGNKYLVPTGSTELHLGDRLFIVAESQNSIDSL